MTGFGSAEDQVLGGRLRVDIRTVNHRYFNPQLKLPADLAGIEGELRERLRQRLERGHVAVTARWLEPPPAVQDEAVSVDLAFVVRQAEVLTATNGGAAAVAWSDVQPIVEQATSDVLAMREREGRALAADLAGRLDALEAGARTVEQRAPERLQAEHARLKQAVAELAAGVSIDPQRLALEVALLAERVDITEELVRFRTHLAACRQALASDGAVGKQLGFLAQELLREVNTMGSKANDAAITQAVIGMKGELEKFREQLENLE